MDVDVPPPPKCLEEEQIKRLRDNGFQLTYIPELKGVRDVVGSELSLKDVEEVVLEMLPVAGQNKSLREHYKSVLCLYSRGMIELPPRPKNWILVTDEQERMGKGLPAAAFLHFTQTNLDGKREAINLRDRTEKDVRQCGLSEKSTPQVSLPNIHEAAMLRLRGGLITPRSVEWTSTRIDPSGMFDKEELSDYLNNFLVIGEVDGGLRMGSELGDRRTFENDQLPELKKLQGEPITLRPVVRLYY